MLDFLQGILLLFYVYLAYSANEWIRYHIFHVEAEYTTSLLDSIWSKILWALILGPISIPVWLLCLFFKR